MKEKSNLSGHRPTWAEIDLDALASNFREVRRRVGPAVKVMGVVKANAYGHGAIECARRLAREGADWLGVALPEEGLELRSAGLEQPILCFGGFWPGQEQACIVNNLIPVVYRVDMVEAMDNAARSLGVVADIHVKIDTGMGRLGVRFDEAREFADAIRKFESVRVDGLMTHFAAADEQTHDPFTEEQTKRFYGAVGVFRERGWNPTYQDLANSAGIFGHPSSWGSMVRPGGVLYGLWRDVLQPLSEPVSFQPVMTLRTRIELLKRVHRGETIGYGCTFEAPREMTVAILPIGYNDGYARRLSNRGRVIVRGHFAPVVGRVSMDLTIIDVTDVPGASVVDIVTLMGSDGELSIPAEEVAKQAGTLSYEITCGISARVPRIYLNESS
ncbi:MAG: alanine racemase [Acidobacteria bacterium 13_1_20CM_3_53_8]|nr:MAG: alanine racemase [Acidobacteria bacterium 13_1_20CM_3_53_8]